MIIIGTRLSTPLPYFNDPMQINSTSLGVPQVHTDSLQRLQNMAARIICRCGLRDHVTPLRKALH